MLDRYDRSVEKTGIKAEDESKLNSLLEAMSLISEREHPKSNRAEQLLIHFAKTS
jgi:hypothetical protein